VGEVNNLSQIPEDLTPLDVLQDTLTTSS